MKPVSFAKTGNIEVIHNGQRVLLGQCVDGSFRLNRERVVAVGPKAYARIDTCAEIAEDYGKPRPPLLWQ